VGFSAGVGVKLAKFSLNYGIASFNTASTAHYFSLFQHLAIYSLNLFPDPSLIFLNVIFASIIKREYAGYQ